MPCRCSRPSNTTETQHPKGFDRTPKLGFSRHDSRITYTFVASTNVDLNNGQNWFMNRYSPFQNVATASGS
jgi:hypothetical protein